MKTRILTVLAVLLASLMVFGLIGCQKKPAEPTGPIQIDWWHSMTGKNGQALEELAKRFNESQTAYKVVPVYKGSYSDNMNAGIAAFRAKQAPHIIQVYEVGTATMMNAGGAIYPVYKLMKDAGEKFDPKVYIPTITGYYSTSKGEMLSLPFNSSTAVMYYNKDAFRKAGLDPEKPPVTWPEFFEVAKKLKASGMEGGFSTNWISWIQLENFSAWHNQSFGTKNNGFDGLDTELVFNTPLTLKHLQTIYELSKDKTFIYGGRENKANPLFTSGTVGMHFESIGGYGNFKNTCKFDFGVARLPYYPDVPDAPQNTIIGGASLWVFNGKPKNEYKGVAKFFTFLSQPESQAY